MYYFPLPYDFLPLQIKVKKNDFFPVSESHCSQTKNVIFHDNSHIHGL